MIKINYQIEGYGLDDLLVFEINIDPKYNNYIRLFLGIEKDFVYMLVLTNDQIKILAKKFNFDVQDNIEYFLSPYA